jgi:hypothetical protein
MRLSEGDQVIIKSKNLRWNNQQGIIKEIKGFEVVVEVHKMLIIFDETELVFKRGGVKHGTR